MEDMISILETYQQYAPKVDGDFIPVPVGGDGLTAKRGEEAQMARKDGASPEAALEGVVLKVEDWHKDTVIMLKVFYSDTAKLESLLPQNEGANIMDITVHSLYPPC